MLELPSHFLYHYASRPYEPMSVAFMQASIRPGMTCVDVGAHIGLMTLWMSRLAGASGAVTVFEPGPDNLRFLRSNIRKNGADNVQVIDRAVASKSGSVTFHLAQSTDSHSLYGHPLSTSRELIQVECTTLGDAVSEPLDFIKIDTEGAELEVIDGLGVMEAPFRRARALVEWAPWCQAMAGREVEELPLRLQELGFAIDVLHEESGRVLDLDSQIDLARAGRLPRDWYANLACTPTEARG